MKTTHSFLAFLAGCSAVITVFAECTGLITMSANVPAAIRFTAPLIFVVTFIILFPLYKKLGSQLSTNMSKISDERELLLRLEKTGKVPLLAMCAFFLSNTIPSIIYAVVVASAVGFGTEMLIYAIMVIALAFVGGAYIYIYSDISISTTFRSQVFTNYPLSLYPKRQALKLIIVPIVTMIIGVAVSLGRGFSVLSNALAEYNINFLPLMARTLPFIACFMALAVGMVLLWARATSGHYKMVTEQLDTMLSSEKDLTKRIVVTTIDEISAIAARVNKFTESLQGMIKDVSSSADSLSTVGQMLSKNADEISSDVSDIHKDIDNLNLTVEEQSASVTETSASITQIARNIESLSLQIENQSAAVTQSSAAVQEMVANVGTISENISKASASLNELKSTATSGRDSINSVQDLVSKLITQSDSLLETNSVINNIASQTNLLAMNAAIEAAHAGEAGKGFAVVADEIRKLAEDSSKQSKAIAAGLKATIEQIRNIAAATKTADDAFETVASKISSVAALSSEIDLAMHEQNEGSRQVLEALRDIENVTVQVRDGSAEMNEGAATILKEMTRLSGVSRDVQERSSSIAQATEAINGAVSEIVENSEANTEAINVLARVTGRFRV